MKRFTETEKWSDSWFRKLPATLKVGYLYLLDRVDNCGVIDLDQELADFQIGASVDWDSLLKELGERAEVLPCGKWHLTRFVRFQFGELRPDCKPHAQVIRLRESHGINRVSKGYPESINTLKDKDKEQGMDKETEKTPDQIRVEKLYRRKVTTKWSAGESRAWRTASDVIAQTTPESWALLEWWYSLDLSKAPYRKTDMAALLNNWHAEIEKASRNKQQGALFDPPPPTPTQKIRIPDNLRPDYKR
jgi:hypothetical protein